MPALHPGEEDGVALLVALIAAMGSLAVTGATVWGAEEAIDWLDPATAANNYSATALVVVALVTRHRRRLCGWHRSVARDLVVGAALLAALGTALSVGRFALELIAFL